MTEPIPDLPEPSASHGTRHRVLGIVVSTMLHLSAVIALVAVSIQSWHWDATAAGERRVIYARVAKADESELTEPEVRIVTAPDEGTGVMIERLSDEARQRSEQENLDRLEKLSERLDSVSSPKSVDTVADAFQTLAGTQARAERPADEPDAGKFDFDTGQFHDVRREATDDGRFQYLCILVDAEGRSTEVVMTEAEGKTAYETMQQIKRNPLLEQVYRRIAMPLFDKMLAAAREPATAAEDLSHDPPAAVDAKGVPPEEPTGSSH